MRNLDIATSANILLNLVMLVLLAWHIWQRRMETRTHSVEQIALMQKTRKVYQLGQMEGESRMVQNLVAALGAGESIDSWMSKQLAHLGERSVISAADAEVLQEMI